MALSSKIAYFYKLSDAVEEVSGNSLTDNGSVAFSAGKIGDGAVGNGSSKSLYGTVSAANVPTTEYHRWCWVNADHPLDGGGGTPLFSPYAKWDGGGDFIFTVWDDGHIDFSNISGGVNSTALLSPNTWHLIHGWWDGANYNVQVDNNTADSASGSTPSSNGSALSILAQAGGFGSYFSGMVDAAGGSNVAWDAGDYAELWSGGAGYEFTYTPPDVTLSASSATVAENGGTATVTATLSASATREATVDISLSGTATGGGVDYTIDTTTITVPVGQSTAAATITAVNNAAIEANKTVIVDISSTTNATESGAQQVTVTIVNDDIAAPYASITRSAATFGENGGTASIIALLDSTASTAVSVVVSLTGTATEGVDYSISSRTISIPSGTSGSVLLTAINDNTYEPNETITASVSSIVGGGVQLTSPSTAVFTIVESLSAPTVSLSSNRSAIQENGQSAILSVALSNYSYQDVTIGLDFAGTATLNTDYTRSTNSIIVSAGQSSGSASVTTLNGVVNDPNETIIVSLGTITNGSKASNSAATVTIVPVARGGSKNLLLLGAS